MRTLPAGGATRRRATAARRGCLAVALALAGTLFAPELARAAELDRWEPAMVVDARPGLSHPLALFSTLKKRAGVVYLADGETWAASWDSYSDRPWEPPEQLQPAPEDDSGGPVVAEPVAVGSGATVFLRSAFGEVEYAQLAPGRSWSDARAFPYASTFAPEVALVYPRSGLAAIGTGRLGGQVRAAFKPEGARWRLSRALDLDGRKEVRGAWYDDHGRPHVLLTRRLDGHLEMYSAVLLGDRAPRWGRVRLLDRGTPGNLVHPERVTVSSGLGGGAITVLWQEEQDGVLRQYVRHRDAYDGWAPARRLPVPALGLPIAAAVSPTGDTRLAYVTASTDQGEGPYDLVSRSMASPDGTLGDEEVVDTFTGDGLALDAAVGATGDLLLAWTTGTSDGAQERLFRCTYEGCEGVGTLEGTPEIMLALGPDGTGFLAGVGGAVPGCPADALCSRRLPSP